MRSIISGIISSGIFLLLYLILGWSVLVSVLISACLYVGLFLISKPKLKIGKVQLSDIDNGEEVKLIYDESIKKMESIED